jgi:hypothetical protein
MTILDLMMHDYYNLIINFLMASIQEFYTL